MRSSETQERNGRGRRAAGRAGWSHGAAHPRRQRALPATLHRGAGLEGPRPAGAALATHRPPPAGQLGSSAGEGRAKERNRLRARACAGAEPLSLNQPKPAAPTPPTHPEGRARGPAHRGGHVLPRLRRTGAAVQSERAIEVSLFSTRGGRRNGQSARAVEPEASRLSDTSVLAPPVPAAAGRAAFSV